MSFYIQTHKVIIQQPPPRAIHPDMEMTNPDFLRGYAVGLKNILHPDSPEPHVITDEDTIQSIKACVMEDPEALAYVLGCYVGYIIAKCQ